MKHVQWIAMGMLVVLSPLAGCSPGGGATGNPLSRSEVLMDKGMSKLSAGEYEEARTTFNEVLTINDPGYVCRAQYGIVLAGVQDTAARLDVIADSAALVLGAAPAVGSPSGFEPKATIDLVPIIRNVLEPFESFFVEILAALDVVVQSGCSVMLPEGMPVEVGNPKSLIYFKARWGNEFDAASARAGQMIFSSALAGIRFVLSHDMEIDSNDMTELANTLSDAFNGTVAMEVNGPGDVSQHTMVYALRSLGAIPAAQAKLLSLGDKARFEQVDNDLALALRAFYSKTKGGETGLLAELLAIAKTDPDPSDNFLGLIDANANGIVDESDSIVVGLRELHLAGIFSEPSIEDGVWFTFNGGIGNIGKIIDAVHEVAQVLGDQFASVDDKGVTSRRLGLEQVNVVIENVTLLDMLFSPLPEAVEFDFGAYFKTPIGIRDLFPYWVDHDGLPGTPVEFLIEGESWVTTSTEPYVTYGDTTHFDGTYTFKKKSTDTPVSLTGVKILADGIEPEALSILASFPLPYVAYQDPTFNGVVYVDRSKLYGAPAGELADMKAATQFSANMATASYFSFVMNEWVYSD